MTVKLFSERYRNALRGGDLQIEIPEKLRRRIIKLIESHNDSFTNEWSNYSSYVQEVERQLLIHYGDDELQISIHHKDVAGRLTLENYVRSAEPAYVLDVIEQYMEVLPSNVAYSFQSELNECFDVEENVIRIFDREAFILDVEMIKMRHVAEAFEVMENMGYGGALEELRESMRDLKMSNHKGAILNAAKAMESLMKKILGKSSGSYMQLVKEIYASGFYENLPEDIREPFKERLFLPLSLLRNKMGGHGQGSDSIEIPRQYAELAINLSSTFIKFLLELKQQEMPSEKASEGHSETSTMNDNDLPF